MEHINPPDDQTSKRTDALEEVIEQYTVDGCSKPGGYITKISTGHEYFRSEGKDPDNTYTDIGTGKYDDIVITHTDLDGLGAGAVYAHREDTTTKLLYANHSSEYSPDTVLEQVLANSPTADDIYVVDLKPESEARWQSLVERSPAPIHIRDHHPKTVSLTEVDYRHQSEHCTTELVLQADHPNPPHHLQKLAEAASVMDHWQADHEKFNEYSLLEIAADVCKRNQLVSRLAKDGTALLADPSIREPLCQLNYERHLRVDWLLGQSDLNRIETVGNATMAAVYGHAPDTSLLGYHVKQHFDADIAALVNPTEYEHGHLVSFRTSEGHAYAHLVAQQLNGDGHPQAASGEVSLSTTEPSDRLDEVVNKLVPAIKTAQQQSGTGFSIS